MKEVLFLDVVINNVKVYFTNSSHFSIKDLLIFDTDTSMVKEVFEKISNLDIGNSASLVFATYLMVGNLVMFQSFLIY